MCVMYSPQWVVFFLADKNLRFSGGVKCFSITGGIIFSGIGAR